MVATVMSHFGQMDAVFANAGRGGSPGGFSAADPSEWRDMLLTNVLGAALTLQACIPPLTPFPEPGGSVEEYEQARFDALPGRCICARRRVVKSGMHTATRWAIECGIIGFNQ